jgi:hypothetical protein
MEYDDRYNPANLNDYDDSNQNQNQKQRDTLKKIQSLNRGYHKFEKKTVDYNGNIKNVEMGMYGSGSPGSQIRNAETGEYYKYKVGTMDEDLFFKTMLSSGQCNLTLFYDSPAQYERHQYVTLDDLIKTRWENKRQFRLNVINQLKVKSKL